jgi:hypothetical protein
LSLNIANLARGAVMEMFEIECQKVLNNISNPNMPATKKRKIIITLELVPDSDRERADISCKSRSVLADPKPIEIRVALEVHEGKTYAMEFVSDMPGQVEIEQSNVRNIK